MRDKIGSTTYHHPARILRLPARRKVLPWPAICRSVSGRPVSLTVACSILWKKLSSAGTASPYTAAAAFSPSNFERRPAPIHLCIDPQFSGSYFHQYHCAAMFHAQQSFVRSRGAIPIHNACDTSSSGCCIHSGHEQRLRVKVYEKRYMRI